MMTNSSPNVLKIGALYSLSGGWGKYGQAQIRAHELWAEQVQQSGGIDGRFDVEIFVEDTAISSTRGVQMAKQFINDYDVDVLLGPNSFAVRQSVSTVTERAGIPQLFFNPNGGGAVPDFCNEYLFTLGATASMAAGEEVVEYLISKYGFDWYLLGSNISLSQQLSAVIKNEVTARGGSIKAENYFTVGHTDFSSILNDIESRKPDVVYCPLTANSAIAFMKEADHRGIRDLFQTVHISLSQSTFKSVNSDIIENALQTSEYFEAIPTDSNRAFVDKFHEKYTDYTGPSQYAGRVYHSLELLTEAVTRAGSTDSEDIKQTLSSLSEVETIYGSSSIPHDNQTRIPYYIARINKDKQFEIEHSIDPLTSPQVCED